jgi:uncharacterized protein (DUF1800 family)
MFKTRYRKLYIGVLCCLPLLGADKDSYALSELNPITGTVLSSDSEGRFPLDEIQARRFLVQATMGPTESSVDELLTMGREAWLEHQLTMPSAYATNPTPGTRSHLDYLFEYAQFRGLTDFTGYQPGQYRYPESDEVLATIPYDSGQLRWAQLDALWQIILNSPDQLRQKMALAMNEMLVIGAGGTLNKRADAIAHYMDVLARHSFGNFEDMLYDVSRTVAMGHWLSHQGNQKANEDGSRTPDENYAREIMQLFSIGLYELNADGTPRLDASGNYIPTYTQEDIEEMARVMTGWSRPVLSGAGKRFGDGRKKGSHHATFMECHNNYHDTDEKVILGEVFPAGQNCEEDLRQAVRMLVNHPNTPVMVAKHLIRRFVTSNPSPGYVQRVSDAFSANENGERGDLAATLKAVLLDTEALDPHHDGNPYFGKIKSSRHGIAQVFRAFEPIEKGPYAYTRYFGNFFTRSPTVFNYYEAEFAPNDEEFTYNGLLAPETQELNEKNQATNFNFYDKLLRNQEVRELVHRGKPEPINGVMFPDFDNSTKPFLNSLMIDLNPAYQVLLTGLGGDISQIQNSEARSHAIDLLLNDLNLRLVEGRLSDQSLEIMKQVLSQIHRRNAERKAIFIVQEAVLLVVSSAEFNVQI